MNKNQKSNTNYKKLIIIAVVAIAFVAVAYSIKKPKQASVTDSEANSIATTDENTEGVKEVATQIPVTVDNDIVIAVNDITETATFYPAKINGTELEVIAVKAPDGTIRTAFNTCQVCYSSGRGYYKQEGDALICQNCGNRFGMDDVEVTKGGCNPVPITDEYKTVKDDTISISKDFLTEATGIFANWK